MSVSLNADGSYRIEFQGGLVATTNVPELVVDTTELLGAFDVDFGASLGDFAGIETQGQFKLIADLMVQMTLGLDLNPSEALEIGPPIFLGNVAEVRVSTPIGSSDFVTQIPTIHPSSAV